MSAIACSSLHRMPQPARRFCLPSMVDLVFAAVLAAGFALPGGWQQLLADGDTGWHVRAGEMVLATGSAPRVDDFSFTRNGAPWYAWEWLADTGFALAFRRGGLAAVAVLAGVVLSLAAALLFARLLWQGCGVWIALAATLAAFSASSVHFLARPHVFSILLYAASLWILEAARAGRRWLVWTLPPVAALWANLHGGFGALPATVALAAVVDAAGRRWADARFYALAAAGCAAATLVNPYGWRLHSHIAGYLNSAWILEHVQEFQSPSIRSEPMLVFAGLLLAGAAMAARAMARGEWLAGTLALVWGLAALRSARHIPLFALAAAPVIAGECALAWRQSAERGRARSLGRIFWDLGQDLGRRRGVTAWLPVLGAALALPAMAGRMGFPENRFPVRAVENNLALLGDGAGPAPRILTSDQWGDYLIFRLYPRTRVFFDGRSDFYGPALGADYSALQAGAPGWRERMARYGFEVALLPRQWALAAELGDDPEWQRVYQDSTAVLFRRGGRRAP